MEQGVKPKQEVVPGAEDTLEATPDARKRSDALISTLAAGDSRDSRSGDDRGAELPPPELISERYRIEQRIGAGGFGVVYRAVDERLQKPVAIKVLGSGRAKDQGALERFRAEALGAGRIHHPGIVTVTDFEQFADGRPYIVMELVPGETLFELLRRETKITVPRACRFARLICQALDAAHHAGIIHRDLKPANVIVREDPRASDPQLKIVDFGIAKLGEAHRAEQITQSGQVLGTPAYIAPEQIREASTLDGRADLYAVGVILYELVTGQLPFKTRNAANLLVSKVVDEPDPPTDYVPDLPPAFVKLVMRSIARDPDDRPRTGAEMAAALEELIDPAAPPPRHGPRWIVPAIVVAAAGAALALALRLWSGPSEPPTAPPPSPATAAPAPPAALHEPPPPPPPAPVVAPAVETSAPVVAPVAPKPPPPKPIVKKKPPPRDRDVLPDSPLAPRPR